MNLPLQEGLHCGDRQTRAHTRTQTKARQNILQACLTPSCSRRRFRHKEDPVSWVSSHQIRPFLKTGGDVGHGEQPVQLLSLLEDAHPGARPGGAGGAGVDRRGALQSQGRCGQAVRGLETAQAGHLRGRGHSPAVQQLQFLARTDSQRYRVRF